MSMPSANGESEGVAMEKEVTLRPIRAEDLDAVLEIFFDESVKKTYMLPDFADRQQAIALFERLLQLSEREDRFVRAIAANDALVGFLNDVEITAEHMELGYVVNSRFQGRGYATAALGLAVEELFRRGVKCIRAGFFEGNSASRRVMEKNGMTDTLARETIPYRGEEHLCRIYEIRNK